MEKLLTTINPTAPFNFELTASQHTHSQGRCATDTLTDGVYRRLLDLDGRLILSSAWSVGSVESPELAVELQAHRLEPEDVEAATKQVAWLLGAGHDLTPFYRLAREDPGLGPIVQRYPGLHPAHTASVFEALILAVLGQQISSNVARIIRALLIETYGPRESFNGDTYYAFPRPGTLAALTVDQLRQMKLSQRKAEYIQGIAEAALTFSSRGMESLHEMADEQVVQKVIELRGVGIWTAQWMLIRSLGRPDALPLGDLALRRVVSRIYFEGAEIDDGQLERFAQRWSPWRSYATGYLFTALRNGEI